MSRYMGLGAGGGWLMVGTTNGHELARILIGGKAYRWESMKVGRWEGVDVGKFESWKV